MKNLAAFALLLGIAATSAQAAFIEPRCDVYYKCHYTNYTGSAVQDGLSYFTTCSGLGGSFIRATEKFQAHFQGRIIWDNRAVVFTKPINIREPNPEPPPPMILVATQWEFTVGPSGPQCKDTVVWKEDGTIEYRNCTDGHTRTCGPVN